LGDLGKQVGDVGKNDAAISTLTEANEKLQNQWALVAQLSQASRDATSSHSNLLGLVLQELQAVKAANIQLYTQIQQGRYNNQ
jgi:hypothetical protein